MFLLSPQRHKLCCVNRVNFLCFEIEPPFCVNHVLLMLVILTDRICDKICATSLLNCFDEYILNIKTQLISISRLKVHQPLVSHVGLASSVSKTTKQLKMYCLVLTPFWIVGLMLECPRERYVCIMILAAELDVSRPFRLTCAIACARVSSCADLNVVFS